ncbi:helix-turn-helix domain-containing protein, partial [Streptomyces phaeochromogenes]|uniref:helix-turn-helix domain-containing protein n=1 Tax=Streptomyces phaeochromogenes TaxID=1923 RepID=UPI0012FE95EC
MWDSIPNMRHSEDVDAVGGGSDPVDARLGVRLAELRAERGWSLGELAERSGVSRSTLSRAERAEI